MIDERRVSEYCYEDPSLIENYERAMNDETQTWVCHHRVGTIMNCGKKELIAQGCYTDRLAHDLIFLTKSEHNRLHNAGKPASAKHRANLRAALNRPEVRAKMSMKSRGRKQSAETRAKRSASLKAVWSRPEYRAKVSASNKAVWSRPETRAKISAANRGKRRSAEALAKMSEAQKGKKLSEETRARLSVANSGENNPMFGKKHSAEARAKMSAAAKNRSKEWCEKISASSKGRKLSTEARAKIGAKARVASTGRHWFNDGVENKFCKECPGPGWNLGMLIRVHETSPTQTAQDDSISTIS